VHLMRDSRRDRPLVGDARDEGFFAFE